MSWVYLDNNATTQPAPEVLDAMRPFYETHWGNPSSLHRFGRDVANAVETARRHVADFLGAPRASTIIFTSSGTEANNMALHGLCAAQPDKRHIVTTRIEHSSVLRYCRALEQQGYAVTYLPVTRDGRVTADVVAQALRPDTACVAVMWANNETGTCLPIEEIAQLCEARAVPLHIDAVQAAAKIPIDVSRIPSASLAISGHKIHAPKGIGALYLRRGTPFRPLLQGGGQEYGRRSGTENVAQIIGLGRAAQLAAQHLSHVTTTISTQRNRLERALLEKIPEAHVNGSLTERVPNTTNVSLHGVDGEGLILALSDAELAASTGSACSAGSTEPSHVLVAMGLSPEELRGTLRLSLSRYTTDDDIDRAIEIIPRVVTARRKLNPR